MPLRLALLLLLLAGLAADEAAAQFALSEAKPRAGEPVTISLTDSLLAAHPPDTLLVLYRPNSSIASTEVILTGGQRTVVWTPAQAGVVALSAPGGARQNVSVRFQEPPASGILVLILAGTILFGGALFAFYKLFQRSPGVRREA